MRDKILFQIARFSDRRPFLLIGLILLLTLFAGYFSENLKLEMQFKNLMPQDHPMVTEFNKIVDDFSTASLIIVAATGEEKELKSFVDDAAPRVRAMHQYIRRVESRLDRNFFLNHGLMLQKTSDLKNSENLYSDLNILPFITHLNDTFEKTYVDDDESISTKEKENNAVAMLDGIENYLKTLQAAISGSPNDSLMAAAAEKMLLGETYFLSQDKDMILFFAQPNFTVNEIDKVVVCEDSIDALLKEVAAKYPSLQAGTTGLMALSRDETVSATSDAYYTSIIALLLILALFILSFRMWVAPILAGIALTIGIIWTAGFAALAVGSLNIMTSMFSVILLGLGIDFSIHIISMYSEKRAAGQNNFQALHETMLKSGKGVITGALTTACAFLTLMVSRTAGMREFGIVAGSGVIFTMLSTLFILPALLSLRDRLLIKIKKDKLKVRSTDFTFLGKWSGNISRKPKSILLAALLLTLFLGYQASKITFDYNYLNMEPVGLTSLKLQDLMEEKFDTTPDIALVTTHSVEEARKIAEKAKKLKIVGRVASISEFIPDFDDQQARQDILLRIHEKLQQNPRIHSLHPAKLADLREQLFRLEDNIIELAQLAYLGGQDKVDKKCREIVGTPGAARQKALIGQIADQMDTLQAAALPGFNHFQKVFAPHFREMALQMCNAEKITVDNLPKNIRDQYISKDGKKYLVTIYPTQGVFKNLNFLETFTRRMQKLDDRITGMPNIFYILIGIIARDGKIAILLTLIVVFLLLWLDFRNLWFVITALIPLLVGIIWMVGLMQLFGLQLTMLNIIGIPLILGIGIDDGVHLLHRFRSESAGQISTVFRSTGKAVLLTSLTTMLAFGSLVFATYRGLGSMGLALFIGVATCFLTSVILLPALMPLMEKYLTNHSRIHEKERENV